MRVATAILSTLLISLTAAVGCSAIASGGDSHAQKIDVESRGDDLLVSCRVARPVGAVVTQRRVIREGDRCILSYRYLCAGSSEPGQVSQTLSWRVPGVRADAVRLQVRQEPSIALSDAEIKVLAARSGLVGNG